METFVILIPIEVDNARKICEAIENNHLVIPNFNKTVYFHDKMWMVLCELGIEETGAIAYPITNFMDIFNDEEMNANNYFMSYVYVE